MQAPLLLVELAGSPVLPCQSVSTSPLSALRRRDAGGWGWVRVTHITSPVSVQEPCHCSVQALLLWLGLEEEAQEGEMESEEELLNMQHSLSLTSWPTTQSLGAQSLYSSEAHTVCSLQSDLAELV